VSRFLVFALLGPPLGLVTAMWGIVPVLGWSLGDPSVFDYHQFILLPLAYEVGLVPALLVGLFDAVSPDATLAVALCGAGCSASP
jgi:hypothetical protein